jgi:hypothetical protein
MWNEKPAVRMAIHRTHYSGISGIGVQPNSAARRAKLLDGKSATSTLNAKTKRAEE